MGEKTGIAWTDSTFNPWHGCQRVSPGCENCYAEALDHRLGRSNWGPVSGGANRQAMSEGYWKEPLRWNRQAEKAQRRHRVFCASMCDVFEDTDHPVVIAARARLWFLIQTTPWLDWQLLTKRPENFKRLLPWGIANDPWPNVWLGVTSEDQRRADERIPILLDTPAVIRFVSYEPALEFVDFEHLHMQGITEIDAVRGTHGVIRPHGGKCERLDWVIVGSESGHGARPARLEWYDRVRKLCQDTGVVFFGKQHANAHGMKLKLLFDGYEDKNFPVPR